MASTNTRWFVVASPTGSTQGEFFFDAGTGSINQSGSKYINLSAVADFGGIPVDNWGTAGNFPTYSAYSPGIYIRDYINSPYTSSIYTYVDSDDVTPVTSIQQDLQKIFFPGIVTGSSAYGFGGRIVTTGSTLEAQTVVIASNNKGSIGFVGTAAPVTFANTVTMSFASVSDNNVNFAGFLTTSVDTDYQLIYRSFQQPNAQAIYNVSGPVTSAFDPTFGDFSGYYIPVSYVSSIGTLVINTTGSVTFIDKAGNQSTFYVVGVANPAAGLPFAGQSTVGTVGEGGDLRSGIIKVYATESNNTADWTSLIRVVSGDAVSNYTNPTYVAQNHNLIMFTASAGNAGTASWELLYTPA
jgi:hypothetical protein